MSRTDAYATVTKAMALGRADEVEKLTSDFTADDHDALHTFGTAVMAVCLGEQFKDEVSLEAIRRFVVELRYEFRNSEPRVKPLMVEGYIRAFAGEDYLLDDIPPTERVHAQALTIRKVVAQTDRWRDDPDALMTEAESLSTQWEHEDDGLAV
ncbi:MAG TPA: hypothetical protein H9881_07490 [Candidatus Stackebrandtia excrementipullorum]|nr:hypothetical protein [Candidatus Stackebrandtia excrementipullorum]